MSIKKSIRNNYLVAVLTASMLIPMGMNALHYVIFHHEKSKAAKSATVVDKQPDHFLCQYEFVSKIIDSQSVTLDIIPYSAFNFRIAGNNILNKFPHLSYLLRAPPSVLI